MKIEELIKESNIVKIDDLHMLKSEYGFDFETEIAAVTVEELEEIKIIIILENKMSCKKLWLVDFLINIIKNKLATDFLTFQKVYNEFKNLHNIKENEKVDFKAFKEFLSETNREIDAGDFLSVMAQIGKQTANRKEM